jgi:hypothetical protein
MKQIILIGLGAGVVTATLVASVRSGVLISIFLFYLAPLPILIAALGWSHWAALVAAFSAAGALATLFGPFFTVTFLIGVGLPAWWLGYLSLLGRPAPNAPGGMEWYPVGRIVVWAAVLGAGVVIAAIPNIGLDEESFRAGLRKAFELMLQMQESRGRLDIPGVSDADMAKVITLLVAIFPLVAAIIATVISLLNLWLSARIVKISGLLKRPWPSLPDMQFPPFAPLLFAAAIAGTFLSGLPGTIAGILCASLSIAYLALGLAVLHAITRTVSARPILLGASYAAIVVLQGLPIPFIAMLGLADTIFNFRGRVAGTPPASRT